MVFAYVLLKLILHIYCLCPHCCEVFSLAMVSRSYSPVAVCGLLIAEASLIVQHRLQAHGLQELWLEGSLVAAPGL